MLIALGTKRRREEEKKRRRKEEKKRRRVEEKKRRREEEGACPVCGCCTAWMLYYVVCGVRWCVVRAVVCTVRVADAS
jgi:hypothetical protein